MPVQDGQAPQGVEEPARVSHFYEPINFDIKAQIAVIPRADGADRPFASRKDPELDAGKRCEMTNTDREIDCIDYHTQDSNKKHSYLLAEGHRIPRQEPPAAWHT